MRGGEALKKAYLLMERRRGLGDSVASSDDVDAAQRCATLLKTADEIVG